MALKATIYKATLHIADMDRHYYQDHHLTIAQHPSETTERMMLRILAFALNASETLQFTKGLSTDDEPDLWQKNLSDEIEVWIELGQPDEKRIRKACNRAARMIIYTYSDSSAEIWWQQNQNKLQRFKNLSVINIAQHIVHALDTLTERSMQLQCTIQDELIWLANDEQSVQIELNIWQA